jgi:uncharacterized protein (UPF0335 family)
VLDAAEKALAQRANRLIVEKKTMEADARDFFRDDRSWRGSWCRCASHC